MAGIKISNLVGWRGFYWPLNVVKVSCSYRMEKKLIMVLLIHIAVFQ